MTSKDEAISSEEGFNTELKRLLRRAHEGNINVEGGWECRNGADHPDWDVVVSEVTKNSNTE